MRTSMSMSRRSVLGAALLVGAGVIGTGSLPGVAEAAVSPPAGIQVFVIAPPSVVPTLSVRLTRDTVDVTAELCVAQVSPDGVELPGLSCPEVPEGAYDLEVTSSDPVVRIARRCEDLASPIDEIVIGEFRSVNCRVVASPPGVVLGPEAIASREPIPPVPPIALLDAGGDDITSGCETSSASGIERIWCIGLPDGVYTARATMPDGYLGGVGCLASPTLDGGLGSTDKATITTDDWLWSCVPDGPYAPLTVTAALSANVVGPEWLSGVTATLTSSGTDRSAACSTVRVSLDTIPPPYVEIHCLGLDPGVYGVGIAGVPDDVPVAATCAEVEVTADVPTFCSFGLGVVEGPVEESDGGGTDLASEFEPALDPEADVLPPTGGGRSALIVVAALAALAGVGLIRTSRRDPMGGGRSGPTPV